MEWVTSLLLITGLSFVAGYDVADFKQQLEEEALKVYRQHMEEMARIPPAPRFESEDLMRSFVPKTGVGNREELYIKSIERVPSPAEEYFTRWRYIRFNNTDYMLSVGQHRVALNKFDSQHPEKTFVLNEEVFGFGLDPKSIVLDVATFTRVVKKGSFLYIAILTQSSKASLVHIYEVVGDKGAPVALIELSASPSTDGFTAKKLSYTQSQFGESLVVLIPSPEVKLVYRQAGSSELNHYIGVYFPSAVDMVTFTVHGHGYVAVANSSNCRVFKLDEFARSEIEFDSLPSNDEIVDVDYFRLGFYHYLFVAGRSEQSVYTWTRGGFRLAQGFGEQGVQQIYSAMLPTCRDDVILIFVRDRKPVLIYLYSGEFEEFALYDPKIPEGFAVSPGSLTSYTDRSSLTVVFRHPSGQLSVFTLETDLYGVKNPVLEATDDVTKFMQGIEEELERQKKLLESMGAVLSDAVRSRGGGEQRITARQRFANLVSGRDLVVHDIEAVLLEWDGSSLTLDQYRTGTEELEKEIGNLERFVAEAEAFIPDILQLDEDAVIFGATTFKGAVAGPSILAKAVNLQSAAGVDLPQLQSELYRLDRPRTIEGTLKFANLTISGNLEAEKINGLDFKTDVMTTNTKQESRATMNFLNTLVVQGDLGISGKLNGIDVSEEVVTLGGRHHVTGTKTFQNGIIAGELHTNLLDGVDMNDLYDRALTKSGDQEVSGTMTFTKDLVTNNITLHGFLNGHNVTELAESIVRWDRSAHITGHKTFTDDVHLESTLSVDGTVNGLRVPDDLFLTDVPQNVTGRKEFLGTVTAHNVQVSGTVDGLVVPDDVVTLTTDQRVSSTLTFAEGIHVSNDVTVRGLVDGVDLVEEAGLALKLNESHALESAVFRGPVTVTGDLEVGGLVNGLDLARVAADVVRRDEKSPVVVESKKHFRKVVAETVNLERMINGYNISVDFMKVHGDQVIGGTKTFKDTVTFDTIEIRDGMLGSFNVTQFAENRLTLLFEEETVQEVEFSDHVIVEGDLTVRGLVNGLKVPRDLVLRGSQDRISNKVFNGRVQVEDLVVQGEALVSGSFGGVDLDRFYRDRITLDGDQEIEGDVWIGGSNVHSVEVDGLVGGINVSEFARNVMSKTKDQVVIGQKTFMGTTTVVGPITTSQGVNGVDLEDLNRRAFKLRGENEVTAHFRFEDVTVNDVMVTGLVNGVNLTRLDEDCLKKSGRQVVTGVNTFENGFHVDGDIVADTVNGLFIPRDVLLKNIPQEITGRFTTETLEVSGDVHVDGFVNELDLSDVAARVRTSDQETVIESDVTFLEPVHVTRDVQVSGAVNGVDLNRLSESVLLREGDQVVGGNKVLRGNVTLRGDVNVKYLNGIDWAEFLADVVRVDRSQTIRSPKVFKSDVEAEYVHAGNADVGLVNGRDLKEFMSDVVFTDVKTEITGKKVFKGPVEISGDLTADLINGLNLRKDVITLACEGEDSPQIITGQKAFTNLSVFGDVIVTGTVNGKNLRQLYEDTLLTDGDQEITGPKVLSFAEFKGDVNAETVNGMVLHDELVTLHTDQDIEGPVTFSDSVISQDINVKGLVDGVDVQELARIAVYLSTNGTVEGEYSLESAVVLGDVVVRGLVNGLDLPQFERNVSEFWQVAERALEVMRLRSEDSCRLAKFLQDVLSKSYYVLDAFVLHQTLEYPASHLRTGPSGELTLVYSESPDQYVAVPHVWTDGGRFEATAANPTLIGRTLVATVGHSELTVHVGLEEKHSFVTIGEAAVESLPRGFKDAAILIINSDEVLVALYLSSRSLCKFYKVTALQRSSALNIEHFGNATIGKDVSSIALFEIHNTPMLAVARNGGGSSGSFCRIYAMGLAGWGSVQSLPITASTAVKHFLHHNYHYLAFTNVAAVHETREPKSVQVYRHSGVQGGLFGLFQKVAFDDARGLEPFRFGDLDELHLAVWNGTSVRVLRLRGEAGLQPLATLHGTCVRDVRALAAPDALYLAVAQEDAAGSGRAVRSAVYRSLVKGSKYIPHEFKYC